MENHKSMGENVAIWRQYYKQALSRPHSKRTELAVQLNESNLGVAIDCGCGTGSDMLYLMQQGFQVSGFDINPDAVEICRNRFAGMPLVDVSDSSFELFNYPKAGVVIANSSLFFADPKQFAATWNKVKSSIVAGGVFAGDFMGFKDSWADNYRSPTSPLSESQVRALFASFEIISFTERDEKGQTSIGRIKHWHTYSVVAVKRT